MKSCTKVNGLRLAVFCVTMLAAAVAPAATITVNALSDDVFPDSTGAIFDITGAPVVLVTPKCTLRMAIASANLDMAVGGVTNGCAAGSGADTIVFATTTPGTIALADRGMSEAPAAYSPPQIIQSALIASRQLTITGPGSGLLTIDGSLPGNTGRRLLTVSDGNQDTDAPFVISGLRLLRGRAIEQGAGCMFSSESVTITDVTFESCESVGGPTAGAFGGALGVGNLDAGSVLPNANISNAMFLANRATRGTSTTALPQVGAAFFGSGTRKVGKVTLSNARFIGNSAESVGALLVRKANAAVGTDAVSITSSGFVSNAATGTAASLNGGRYGGFQITGITGNVTLNDTFAGANTANQERAGFSITTVSGTTTITNGGVQGNIAVNGRIGGFEVLTDNFDPMTGVCLGTSKNPVNISGVGITGNLAATNTAGFRVVCSGTVSIADTGIRDNEVFGSDVAGSGGNSAGNVATNLGVTMTNVQVIHNKTFSGAVDGGFSVLTVQDNTSFDGSGLLVQDNYAQRNEGGLTLRATGAGRNFTLTNSAFVNNRADGAFSALFLSATGNYTVRNSTFSGNSSSTNGAVFVNMNAASGSNAVVFENVTSARSTGGNLALEVGSFGMPNTPNGTVTVKNTILGSGTSGLGFASVNLQPVASVTYAVSNSLIENNSFGVPAGICGVSGNLCNVDARLENLAANGGFPTLTHALRPGSPALNSGNSAGVATFDQRGTGFPRIVGPAVDMGAFESPALIPGCSLDVDGNGTQDALTDGLLLIRALFGLTGTAVTNGALGASPARGDWASIRTYLNGSCGANFAP